MKIARKLMTKNSNSTTLSATIHRLSEFHTQISHQTPSTPPSLIHPMFNGRKKKPKKKKIQKFELEKE